MTAAERQTPDYLTAWSHCRMAAENFHATYIKFNGKSPGYESIYETSGRQHFAAAAAALGYRLVKLEPVSVTEAEGFDGRDGGRMHEISSAQEA